MECKMCHISEFIIDDDYQMCCNCYLNYDKHNPKVIDDFENGIIKNEDENINLCINCSDDNVKLIKEQYICLSCGCSNGYKFDDYKNIEYYKKMFYNITYKNILKNMKNMKILIE